MFLEGINTILSDMPEIGEVHLATEGKQVVRLLNQFEIGLIISDINMPKMDGQALVEHIRSEMGNTFVPILVVTSEQNQTRLGQVEQAGVSAILDKPFEPQSIREILYRVLDDRT